MFDVSFELLRENLDLGVKERLSRRPLNQFIHESLRAIIFNLRFLKLLTVDEFAAGGIKYFFFQTGVYNEGITNVFDYLCLSGEALRLPILLKQSLCILIDRTEHMERIILYRIRRLANVIGSCSRLS